MKGATDIIADQHSAPATTVHPGLFFSQSGQESEPITAGQFDWDPDRSSTGPVSVIVSSADKTVYVYRNGVEIGRAGIPNPQVISPLNDLVFSALQGTDANGHLRLGGSDSHWREQIEPKYFFDCAEKRAASCIPGQGEGSPHARYDPDLHRPPRRSDDAEPSQLSDSRCAKGQACKDVTSWS